jgi:omega-6 fatty acid desaturase (delta-12 desaturase)
VTGTQQAAHAVAAADWRAVVARYQRANPRRAIGQIATTLVPLAIMFYLMFRSLAVGYWLTLLLALPAAGLLIRTFIIMHDCAHGSFLPSKRANDVLGWTMGILMLTPFEQWRHDHALHHASSGDLTRRGHGDVATLTVREYFALSPARRRRYRLMRSPFVLFGLGPLHFLVMNRLPARNGSTTKRQRNSVWSTNLGIAAVFALLSAWVGWRAVLAIYGPTMYIAAATGIWLFYVQHQFEQTYRQDHGEWNNATAAIRGSSYLDLPAVLRWFTGSIGLHHVHHLGPRIPNYALKQCHDENAMFHGVTRITIARSVRTFRLALWDEAQAKLVAFRDVAAPTRVMRR